MKTKDQPKEKETNKIHWLPQPEEHDYPAAASYLGLIFDEHSVARMVKDLKSAPVTMFKAKDIFRASKLSLLGVSNSHVRKDRELIKAGKPISPLLLIRNSATASVIIADGYHRICAVYGCNEDALIPCKIACTV